MPADTDTAGERENMVQVLYGWGLELKSADLSARIDLLELDADESVTVGVVLVGAERRRELLVQMAGVRRGVVERDETTVKLAVNLHWHASARRAGTWP